MIGTVIDRTYQILHELARDDRGATYLALVLSTNEVVDLRFVSLSATGSGDSRRRFHREVTLLGGLDNAHVVRLFKHGEHEGVPYLVFEHLPGVSLRTVIDTLRGRRDATPGCLSEEQALRIARQVAMGLAYGHAQKVLHRALTPQAVLVGNEGLVKIVDYRLAKSSQAADITQPGHIVTPATPSSYTGRTCPRRTCTPSALSSTRCSPARRPSRLTPCRARLSVVKVASS
jgi:serine/threonine protein kinase